MPPRQPPPTRVRATRLPTRRQTDPSQLNSFCEKGGLRAALFAGWCGRPTAAPEMDLCEAAATAYLPRPCPAVVSLAPVDSGRSMVETADDLSTPLGQETVTRGKRRYRLPFTGTQALAVLLGLFLVTFASFVIFNDNPMGGEPVARIALRQGTPVGEKPATTPSDTSEPVTKSAARQAAPGEQKTVTIIDGSSGARHDVAISGDAPDKVEADAAPVMMAGVDQRLLEKSRYGMIPVVS